MLPSNKNGGSGTMEALKTKSKGIQAVRIDFFLFIFKVTNIRCFILIKCSEQEARFKKICYSVVISEKNSNVSVLTFIK
jgi:hypothetical protein